MLNQTKVVPKRMEMTHLGGRDFLRFLGWTDGTESSEDFKQSNRDRQVFENVKRKVDKLDKAQNTVLEALPGGFVIIEIKDSHVGSDSDGKIAYDLAEGALWTLVGGKWVKSVAVKLKGVSVIGPRSTYREFAQKIGADFLNVTDEAWTMRENVKFLQNVVRRGDDVIFAGKYNPDLLNQKSVLAQEIRYLQRHGYIWNNDFTKLIKK